MFELVGIPVAVLALVLTFFESREAAQQSALARMAFEDQRRMSAYALLGTDTAGTADRFTALDSLLSSGHSVSRLEMPCEETVNVPNFAYTCNWVFGFDVEASDGPADVDRASLSYANLQGQRFSGPVLRELTVERSNLVDVYLSGATISDVQIRESTAKGLGLDGEVSNLTFIASDVTGASFDTIDLATVEFDDSNVSGAILCFTMPCDRPPDATFSRAWYFEDTPPIGLEEFEPPLIFGAICPSSLRSKMTVDDYWYAVDTCSELTSTAANRPTSD